MFAPKEDEERKKSQLVAGRADTVKNFHQTIVFAK